MMSDTKSTTKPEAAKVATITPVTKTEATKEKEVEKVTETTATQDSESKVTEVAVKGKVLVKNIFKRNIHTSIGKICDGETGYVPISEAEAEAAKAPEDRRFLEV